MIFLTRKTDPHITAVACHSHHQDASAYECALILTDQRAKGHTPHTGLVQVLEDLADCTDELAKYDDRHMSLRIVLHD